MEHSPLSRRLQGPADQLLNVEHRTLDCDSKCESQRLGFGVPTMKRVANVLVNEYFLTCVLILKLLLYEYIRLFREKLKLNFGASGFYRVNYPSEFISRFIPAIQNKSISPIDRLMVIDDIFAMVNDSIFCVYCNL